MIKFNRTEAINFLCEHKQNFFDSADKFGFSTFDTCLYWAYYYADSNIADVYLYKNLLVCIVKMDLRSIYKTSSFIIPFTLDINVLREDIISLHKECKESIMFIPDKANKILELPTRSWLTQDKACYTNFLITIPGGKLARKRNGIKKYLKDDFKIIPWMQHNKNKAHELIDYWVTDKSKRRSTDGIAEDLPFRLLIDMDEDGLKLFGSGKGLFVEYNNKYIAFGLGLQISNNRWTMMARITNCDYQYVSDFIFNECAKLWANLPEESDGPGFNIENDTLSRYKKYYANDNLSTNFYVLD